MYYSKLERLQIVLEIVNKLKNFRCQNNTAKAVKHQPLLIES